jgi:hypothetical protein
MDNSSIKYKTNFFNKEREIVFAEDSISSISENHAVCQINKEELDNVRFGIAGINGLYFRIGRIYCIDINNGNNKLIKIRLRTLYGINKKKLSAKYIEMLNQLYNYYLNEKIDQYVNLISEGVEIKMSGIIFSSKGIFVDEKKSSRHIPWEDINSRAYTYYYSIASKKDPGFCKSFTYLTDWNAVIVYSISRQILKSKGLYTD